MILLVFQRLKLYKLEEIITIFVSFSGITPLHIAMMNDDKPCVDALLRHGADPKMLVRLVNHFLLQSQVDPGYL